MDQPSRLSLARLALPLALVAAAVGCSARAATPIPVRAEEPVVSVRTAPIEERALAVTAHASGRLAADQEAKLSFKIGGVVARVLVDEGQRVKQGQLLASLDPSEIEAQVHQASTGLDKAERDLARITELEKGGGVTRQNREDATTARDLAKETLTIASFNQKHAFITAPFAGRIVKRSVEAGELIGPGASAFTVQSDEQTLVAKVGLVDKDALRVSVGDKADVTIDASGAHVNGVVDDIAPQPSAAGTYEARIRLDAPTKANASATSATGLRAGLTVKANVTSTQTHAVRVLPSEAIVAADGARASVFTIGGKDGDSRAHKVNVTIGALVPGGVTLVSSESPIDNVVTEGRAWLSEHARVIVASQNVGGAP